MRALDEAMRLFDASSACRASLLWGFLKNEGQGFDLESLGHNLSISGRAALSFIDGSGCDMHGAVVHDFKAKDP